MGLMASFKSAALCLIVFLATALCSAQQHFPLTPGEWTGTTSDPVRPGGQPMTMLFCMNDELWMKALTHNPTCTFSNVSLSASGGSYSLDCSSKSMQMKGAIKMTFDGMTHMISYGSLDMTLNGNNIHKDSTVDFRWKGPACNPAVDMNLRDHSVPPPH